MKKKIFPIVTALVSIFFMTSCESDEPFSGDNTSQYSEVNKWMYEDIFVPNYLWDVTDSPNKSLSPESFFESLINKDDKISKIEKVTDTGTTSYEIGFEYAANQYKDGKIYYIIYYVNPNSDAERNGLKRGYIITEVNGVSIKSTEDAKTRLENAYKEGKSVDLTYVIPPTSDPITKAIQPSATTVHDPIYASNIVTKGSNKVGYLLYNKFTPGSDYNYDDDLAKKFEDFMTAGVNYLVLDLRYNGGGNLSSSAVLASAIVENRKVGDNFILYVKNRTKGGNAISPISLTNKTKNGYSIPTLGDQLKRIYVITGQYTAGASLAFINALKAYTPVTTIFGEQTESNDGTSNIAINLSEKENYQTTIALAYMANKNDGYNYANGFTPNKVVSDVNQDELELLYPLGDESENIFYAVLQDIAGLRSTSVNKEGAKSLYSPLSNSPSYNKSIINLDDLN